VDAIEKYPIDEQEAVPERSEKPTVETLLTIEELSKWLGTEKSTIYAWTHKKMIPHIKLGKKMLRFRVNEILAWLSEKSISPRSETPKQVKKQRRSSGKSSASDDYINRIIEEAKSHVSRN
jgi:excisionase family DNA binding protein